MTKPASQSDARKKSESSGQCVRDVCCFFTFTVVGIRHTHVNVDPSYKLCACLAVYDINGRQSTAIVLNRPLCPPEYQVNLTTEMLAHMPISAFLRQIRFLCSI